MVLELATNVDTNDVWMPERGGKVSLALESRTVLGLCYRSTRSTFSASNRGSGGCLTR